MAAGVRAWSLALVQDVGHVIRRLCCQALIKGIAGGGDRLAYWMVLRITNLGLPRKVRAW